MLFFFDLDGTLRQTKSGATFINKPDEQQRISGAYQAVKYYASKGFTCVGITNQAGVAAGHKSIQEAIEEQQITLYLFPELDSIYFCPDFEGEDCWVVNHHHDPVEIGSGEEWTGTYRKGAGMIKLATAIAHSWAGDLEPTIEDWMTGDRPEDYECAKSAGVSFIWANMMLDKFNPGIHERAIANIDKETLLRFLAI